MYLFTRGMRLCATLNSMNYLRFLRHWPTQTPYRSLGCNEYQVRRINWLSAVGLLILAKIWINKNTSSDWNMKGQPCHHLLQLLPCFEASGAPGKLKIGQNMNRKCIIHKCCKTRSVFLIRLDMNVVNTEHSQDFPACTCWRLYFQVQLIKWVCSRRSRRGIQSTNAHPGLPSRGQMMSSPMGSSESQKPVFMSWGNVLTEASNAWHWLSSAQVLKLFWTGFLGILRKINSFSNSRLQGTDAAL